MLVKTLKIGISYSPFLVTSSAYPCRKPSTTFSEAFLVAWKIFFRPSLNNSFASWNSSSFSSSIALPPTLSPKGKSIWPAVQASISSFRSGILFASPFHYSDPLSGILPMPCSLLAYPVYHAEGQDRYYTGC